MRKVVASGLTLILLAMFVTLFVLMWQGSPADNAIPLRAFTGSRWNINRTLNR